MRITIFKAKNDSATKDRLPHQMETYLRDQHGTFIHPNAVRYFLYQALELLTPSGDAVFNPTAHPRRETLDRVRHYIGLLLDAERQA